uniref:ATP synthase protein 8 n=2 Tax=Cladonia TaxID=5199 RepID=A0A385I6C9_9LECA|nr:ATP synthase F0 subunit 8 [Cladonia leporina]YP_009655115.1 ATP synthase subunit 8 [Cladonia macilenta]YP_010632506.1 ATP synthase F0 subunit 8 [Cladonia coccifera]YP_010632593.1 ATP synthase F0 subunit 8 [Cladonia didyma]AXY66349.1 ATP synthase F0 subunit 8 [Cladonia leporina]QCL16956.1 ATP synthase subunit 8 [Cladonia macilenta]WBP63208.1 ATP synthase F0 subunit 8 [Cladonia macilenta]WBP63257.1 ATP synthase F0 subunit 8 [Cladonia coccifera]WBP63363.1 ATP synthase F0 subunit 8 [Cladonia
MPQLVPFYFLNQIIFAFVLLTLMIYTFSKYILPRFTRLFTARIFLTKL